MIYIYVVLKNKIDKVPHNLNTTYPDITVPLCIVMPGLEVIEMTGGAG